MGNGKSKTNVVYNIFLHKLNTFYKNCLTSVILDPKLSFEDHINKLCKKANQKRNALSRFVLYIGLEKMRTFMKAFVTFVVRIFQNRGLNNKMYSLHETTLRM